MLIKLIADHDLTINIADLEREKAIDLGEDTAVVLKNGKMSFDLDGQFSRDSLNLPFFLKIKDLTVDVRPGKKILGLDEENAEEILNSHGIN